MCPTLSHSPLKNHPPPPKVPLFFPVFGFSIRGDQDLFFFCWISLKPPRMPPDGRWLKKNRRFPDNWGTQTNDLIRSLSSCKNKTGPGPTPSMPPHPRNKALRKLNGPLRPCFSYGKKFSPGASIRDLSIPYLEVTFTTFDFGPLHHPQKGHTRRN